MKVSIIIPVYYNEESLGPLYDDLKQKVIEKSDYHYEIVMVDDGSGDKSFFIMQELAAMDPNIKAIKLSRNFGSHAAVLCGLDHCTGDCALVKAADLQEPSEIVLDMIKKWQEGNNVVLAVRKGREESWHRTLFANLYYWLTRKVAFPNMPKNGFDVYLVDRKVIDVLSALDERNSALTGQLLWSGFKTGYVEYIRRARKTGMSRWTLNKKMRLAADTLFSFSTIPIKMVEFIGVLSFLGALVWALIILFFRARGAIVVAGWTTLFIFNLFSFGMIMVTLGVLGEYLWRTFDASRNRPTYIVEESVENIIYHKEGG